MRIAIASKWMAGLGMAVALVGGVVHTATAELGAAEWRELNGRFKKAFMPLPTKKVFVKPMPERRKCQQAPEAAGAIEAREAERTARADMLQQYTDLREARPGVIDDLGKANDGRALEALAVGLKIVNADLKALSELERDYAEAMKVYQPDAANRINYTIKGDQEWHKWVQKEATVISKLIATESRIKHSLLESFAAAQGGDGIAWLRDALIKNKSDEVRAGAAQALGASDADGNVAALVQAYGKEKNGMVRAACIDGLLTRRATDEKATFLAALKDEVWEVRAAAVDGIDSLEFGGADTIEGLIECLVVEEGRLRGDIEEVLHRLTGMRFFADGLLWRKWWADNKEKFVADGGKPVPAGGGDGPGVTSGDLGAGEVEHGGGDKGGHSKAEFYGIQTFSNRIVFILDRSGSMEEKSGDPGVQKGGTQTSGHGGNKGKDDPSGGPEGDTKLDTARWELKKAVMGLASDVNFTLIFYNNGIDIWKEDLQPATRANKKDSLEFVWDLPPSGSTNIGDALKKAFAIGQAAPGEVQDPRYGKGKFAAPDTIFLLSDGSPTTPDGQVVPFQPILEDVRKMNKLRRVVIHTIGIGKGDNRAFMETLAKENNGTYVHRD